MTARAALLALLLALPACASEGAPLAATSARDLRAAVHDGAFTTDVTFDGGAVRVGPPDGAQDPQPGEEEAVRLVRSATPPGSTVLVRDVVVGLGRATVDAPVATDGVLRPVHPPQFRDRLVWLVAYEGGVAHSCPAQPAGGRSPVPGREPVSVLLLAADGSGEGIRYTTAGAFCGWAVPARATTATSVRSLAWQDAGSTAASVHVTVTPPPCAAVSTWVGPGSPDTTVAVGADVLLAQGGCTGGGRPAAYDAPRHVAGGPLRHAPTGLVAGLTTADDGGFSYYDGRD